MKKILIIMMLTVMCSLQSQAGEALGINRFFSSKYATNPKVTVIDVSNGDSDGDISVYRSISVSDDRELADKIAEAVAKDGSKARSKEVSYKQGMLYYGFFSMGGIGKKRKYILYLNRRPTGMEKTTLVYIEAGLDETQVKKLINK